MRQHSFTFTLKRIAREYKLTDKLSLNSLLFLIFLSPWFLVQYLIIIYILPVVNRLLKFYRVRRQFHGLFASVIKKSPYRNLGRWSFCVELCWLFGNSVSSVIKSRKSEWCCGASFTSCMTYILSVPCFKSPSCKRNVKVVANWKDPSAAP